MTSLALTWTLFLRRANLAICIICCAISLATFTMELFSSSHLSVSSCNSLAASWNNIAIIKKYCAWSVREVWASFATNQYNYVFHKTFPRRYKWLLRVFIGLRDCLISIVSILKKEKKEPRNMHFSQKTFALKFKCNCCFSSLKHQHGVTTSSRISRSLPKVFHSGGDSTCIIK